jgi:8-amino-7-oxononanoate synthase
MESRVGPRVIFDGREYDYFSGTGYLGLQSHPQVIEAAQDALERYGFATATSRGGLGEHPLYDALEQQACRYFSAEKMLSFPSGYMGSSILTQALSNQFEHIFIDSSAHFSLWDAAQGTNKAITPFQHLQPERLAVALQRELCPGERPLVLSDGVFPISGEIAPLPDYLTLAKSYNGMVFLDDAHAVGVLGPRGQGVPDYYHIQDASCRTSATLAKALGGYGGLIWGGSEEIDYLDQNARICIGTSPLPLPVVAASAAALKLAYEQPGLRQNLWDNVNYARLEINKLGWQLPNTPVPILCLPALGNMNLNRIHIGLINQGIATTLARSYTSTPAGGALRIAIFANHARQQIDHLVFTLQKCL